MKTAKTIFGWFFFPFGWAAAIALFWTVFYLFAGFVPTVSNLEITESWKIALPVKISRWCDALIPLLWCGPLAFFIGNKKLEKIEVDLWIGSSFGLLAGLIVGLCFFNGVHSLFWAPGILLFLFVVFCVTNDPPYDGLIISLPVSLCLSLVFGLIWGLPYGLVIVLSSGIFFLSTLGLVWIFNNIKIQTRTPKRLMMKE